MTKVESAIEHLAGDVKEIKTDIRSMLGLMFTFSIIILAIMIHGFKLF